MLSPKTAYRAFEEAANADVVMPAVSNTHLLGNTAQNGGAVFLSNCTDSVLSGNTYGSNTATVQGGALYTEKCGGDYVDNLYISNGAQRAGAVYFTNAKYCLFQVRRWLDAAG